MIELLQQILYGFTIATWIGTILGFIQEWNGRAFVVIMFLLASFVLGSSVIVSGGGGSAEVAASINWIVTISTIPGYMLGFPFGGVLYTEYW